MKKAIVTLSVLLLTALSAFAGGDKTSVRYATPKFTQGWFLDGAGTYSVFAATGSAYHVMSTYYGGFNNTNPKHLFGASVKLGKRVSPSVAIRVGYDWHQSNNRNGDFNFKSLHFDAMESPLDLFFGYNPDRFYTMWVYGGVGLLAADKATTYPYLVHWDSNLEFGLHGGIMNNFRLSNSLDLHIDLTAVATRWSFDDTAYDTYSLWHRAHFDFSGMVGLMWYLGGRRFDAITPCKEGTESSCTEQNNRIAQLNEEIGRLRSELDNCGNGTGSSSVSGGEARPCDTIIKFVNVDGATVSYPFSIFFNKGSYELRDGRDLVNLREIATVAKNEGCKVTLRGTCDSATASSAFNKTLAENRCNKIKAELVKLGVPEKDIIIDAVGGVSELTPAEYDRRVLIQLSK